MRTWSAIIASVVLATLDLTGPAQAAAPVPSSKPGQMTVTHPSEALAASPAGSVPVPAIKTAPAHSNRENTGKLVLRDSAPAKSYFGAMTGPAPLEARAIGSYAKGCLAGGASLAHNGPGWQVMRLSRNRNWGHPVLIDFLEDLARDAPKLGWRGLLVGDMAQPRGGPMTSGHASHQIGLDADIWLKQMPAHRMDMAERENVSAISMLKGPMDVKGADRSVDPAKWTDTHARLIRRAAQDPRVARIFVSPAIKKALCRFETGDRSWLRVIRPWWGHHYHFHVRLSCPAGSAGCEDQSPPPPGDGCGEHLAYWLSDEPWVPKKPKDPKNPPKVVKKKAMQLAALPKACKQVLTAQ